MSDLNTALTRKKPADLYRFHSSAAPVTIKKFVQKKGWRFFYLDGRRIANKQEFLTACVKSFALPAYFGNNWDALEECLHDLSPADGYVVLFDLADKFMQTEDWQTAVSIFQGVLKEKNLYMLVRGEKVKLADL
jgi:RNAse (barnase) inhibitor barstar